jgi:hypothetical protein
MLVSRETAHAATKPFFTFKKETFFHNPQDLAVSLKQFNFDVITSLASVC